MVAIFNSMRPNTALQATLGNVVISRAILVFYLRGKHSARALGAPDLGRWAASSSFIGVLP